MPEATRLLEWLELQARPLTIILGDHPLFALFLFPPIIGLLSRNLGAFAGALASAAVALGFAAGGTTEMDRVMLPAVLGAAAILFAVSGFGQRRLVARIRDLELRHAEAERRLSEQQERQLLRSVRRRLDEPLGRP